MADGHSDDKLTYRPKQHEVLRTLPITSASVDFKSNYNKEISIRDGVTPKLLKTSFLCIAKKSSLFEHVKTYCLICLSHVYELKSKKVCWQSSLAG